MKLSTEIKKPKLSFLLNCVNLWRKETTSDTTTGGQTSGQSDSYERQIILICNMRRQVLKI